MPVDVENALDRSEAKTEAPGERLRLGRFLIALASMALPLALGLSNRSGLLNGLVMSGSVGLGWLAWFVCRSWPNLVAPGLTAAYLSVPLLDLLVVALWKGNPLIVGVVILVLIYPIILGCGMAWWAYTAQQATANRAMMFDFIVVFATFIPAFTVIPALMLYYLMATGPNQQPG